MAWTLTGSVDGYLAGAGDFLSARPAESTVELTATQTLLDSGLTAFGDEPPLFGWWHGPDGEVAAAAFHTPPYPLLLAGSRAAAPALAAELAARRRPLVGINAPAELAAAFAGAWRELTGARAAVHRRSRLFELGELADPDPVPPGAARVATEADAALVRAWSEEFAVAINDLGGDVPSQADERLRHGGITLWEVDGTAVAMVGNTRPAAGVVRIGPVYTPPDLRRRGYGGAATAAVSRAAGRAGARAVVLFTDLANPTSNALYQRLGYRAVSDREVLAFGASSSSSATRS